MSRQNGSMDLGAIAQREQAARMAVNRTLTETQIAVFATLLGRVEKLVDANGILDAEVARAAAAIAVDAAPFLLEAKGMGRVVEPDKSGGN